MRWTYKKAGVDIEAGKKAVDLIKEYARRTFRSEVISEIGAFGGLFSLVKDKYREPVLVASTDGVGTKLTIAQAAGRHDTVGQDLVAMCVNDVVVQGAEPLFFLDYIACGRVVPEVVAEIIKGISHGCVEASCALLGGETAELPDFYRPDQYDLAGFAVGVVEKRKVIDGKAIREDDVILGVASSGLHSNGYSLVRKVFAKPSPSLTEELLIPTKIYVKSALKMLDVSEVHGLAHITGGGLPDNISRLLPPDLDAEILPQSWTRPPVFNNIQKEGNIEDKEMLHVFNMGIGLAIILPSGEVSRARKALEKSGEKVFEIGRIRKGRGQVTWT